MLTVLWQTKSTVSFRLEDKHVVIQKSHEAKRNVFKWCISMYHMIGLKQTRDIKSVTLKATKTFVGVAVYWEVVEPLQF